MTDETPIPFDELAENFEFLDDWEERYRYVIELGRKLPPFPDALRGPETKVDGCASQVWIAPRMNPDESRLNFIGDSDAHIVRGLIYVLWSLFSGQDAREIVNTDAAAALERIGLKDHLSAQRSNGVRAMVERIRFLAAGIADAGGAKG